MLVDPLRIIISKHTDQTQYRTMQNMLPFDGKLLWPECPKLCMLCTVYLKSPYAFNNHKHKNNK